MLSFLPEDAEAFTEIVGRVGKVKRREIMIAHLDDFSQLFDTIVRVKHQQGVHNSAVAVRLLAQLANERLDQLESEE